MGAALKVALNEFRTETQSHCVCSRVTPFASPMCVRFLGTIEIGDRERGGKPGGGL